MNKKGRPLLWTSFLEAKLFYFDQIVFTIAHAKFNSMLQTGFPVGVRMGVGEVVMMTMFFFCKDTAADHWLTVYCICTSLIQSNRVEGSEHTDIWYDRNIISAWQSQ